MTTTKLAAPQFTPLAPVKSPPARPATQNKTPALAPATDPASAPAVKSRGIIRDLHDGICVLTFDRPESSANVFDRATLEELDAHLNAIAHTDVRGLVIASAKPSIFIAGADLHAMAGTDGPAPSSHDLFALVEFGQAVFTRVAKLPFPTVAAIHGACLGGGYELCLACDYRLASPDRATRIGLPETQLGILPAWGGSTRLPRLVGLPKALNLILSGKALAAPAARRSGLVDELVPRERLVERACELIRQRDLRLRSRPRTLGMRVTNNALAAKLIRTFVQRQLLAKTRGHYPAALKALEVVCASVSGRERRSFARERDALVELAGTSVCQNLIRLFFLQERAKKLAVAGRQNMEAPPVQQAAVIGAGVMGAGIAQWLSARGVGVLLRDLNAEQVAKGIATAARLYEKAVQRRTFTPVEARQGMDRIRPAEHEVPLDHTDLIIEAAVEKIELKRQIFRDLAARTGPDTILATNTSALSVTDMANASGAPERVLGLHFFNPVHRMQLVEVVTTSQTDPVMLQRAIKFVQRMGKLPVLVKDSPGFVVNRILMPYLVEAGLLFEGGAGIEDIDRAMLDFGMPMGPLRLLDEVGIDVAHHVADTLSQHFGDRLQVPAVLDRMIEAGWLGRKAERGFYRHQGREAKPCREVRKFQKDDRTRYLPREALQERMVLLMVNEAARCLEEGVADEAADIDFAMVMGTGFAPFRGGPLRYAEALGIRKLVRRLNELADAWPHFKPCDLLQTQAEIGHGFYAGKGGGHERT